MYQTFHKKMYKLKLILLQRGVKGRKGRDKEVFEILKKNLIGKKNIYS